jgi:hypothetical protein
VNINETSAHQNYGGTSGDPLLKRLVDLAQLGWQARLILLSNGQYIEGTLVSPKAFRTAMASEIRDGMAGGPSDPLYETLDAMIAAAIDAEDPGPSDLGAPSDIPEPRFIHLAEVLIGRNNPTTLPFVRLRLPAVSGFWVVRLREHADASG